MVIKERTLWAFVFVLMALFFLGYADRSMASPDFTVGTTIYGDPRETNPNGIQTSVYGEVFFDTVQVTVDLAPMAAPHPDVLLQAFYFNLAKPASDYTVIVNDPASWMVTNDASPSGAGAGASSTFMFEATGEKSDRPDVDNPLIFTIVKNAEFLASDFNDAETFNSNDVILGGGSVGGKFQSLNITGCAGCDDSGFALGDWAATTPTTPTAANAPGTIALLSLGLVGLIVARRRK